MARKLFPDVDLSSQYDYCIAYLDSSAYKKGWGPPTATGTEHYSYQIEEGMCRHIQKLQMRLLPIVSTNQFSQQ
jgi:hypothetical protein